MELAIETQTSPAAWREESDQVIATALDVLADRATRARQATRKGARHRG